MSAIPLSVSLLRRDGGTQPRGDLCSETVRQLAEALSAGEVLPPVVVFFDGADYWLADGFHRVAGTELAGLDLIDCDIRQGTQRDAILCSCGANKEHDSVGRRRSNTDKRRAVERMLRDKEWSGWSDRRIAEHIGVSNNMVSEMRRLSSDDSQPQTRVGRDGRTTNVNGIGKTPNGIILNAGNRSALAGELGDEPARMDRPVFDWKAFDSAYLGLKWQIDHLATYKPDADTDPLRRSLEKWKARFEKLVRARGKPVKQVAIPPEPALLDGEVFTFPVKDGSEWVLPYAVADALQKAFPTVDFWAEIRKAQAWCHTEEADRKTIKGMPRFLRRWMTRSHTGQERRATYGKPAADLKKRFADLDEEKP